MAATRSLNLRLDADLYDQIDTVALVTDSSITDVIRNYLKEGIKKARNDAEFQRAVTNRLETKRARMLGQSA